IGRDNWRETVLPAAKQIQAQLAAVGVRVTLDERDERPGWKFSEWEMRGVPLRVEIGPKDIEKSAVLVARRDTREKQSLSMDGLPATLLRLLDDVQTGLFARAVQFRDEHTQRTRDYGEFKQMMGGRPGNRPGPGCAADHRQRRHQLHRHRLDPLSERLAQVVEGEPAPAFGKRDVGSGAHAPPLVALPGRLRAFTLAHAIDDANEQLQ